MTRPNGVVARKSSIRKLPIDLINTTVDKVRGEPGHDWHLNYAKGRGGGGIYEM